MLLCIIWTLKQTIICGVRKALCLVPYDKCHFGIQQDIFAAPAFQNNYFVCFLLKNLAYHFFFGGLTNQAIFFAMQTINGYERGGIAFFWSWSYWSTFILTWYLTLFHLLLHSSRFPVVTFSTVNALLLFYNGVKISIMHDSHTYIYLIFVKKITMFQLILQFSRFFTCYFFYH